MRLLILLIPLLFAFTDCQPEACIPESCICDDPTLPQLDPADGCGCDYYWEAP